MAYEKRRYQTEAIDTTLAAFAEKGRESVLLESPVGSGKTYMALEMLHRLQEKLGRQLRINWVAPRHRLLQQVMEANRDLYRDSIRPVSLFASSPPEADFVVLDEAHHEATQSCVLLYEKMRAKWTLGLSATPLRTDRMKLSFQETVRTCPIGRLIREGYLSPFNSYLIPPTAWIRWRTTISPPPRNGGSRWSSSARSRNAWRSRRVWRRVASAARW